jgi:hypothetical protein
MGAQEILASLFWSLAAISVA